MTARYGLYFAPADTSPLAAFGQAVLVRTALDASGSGLPSHAAEWMQLIRSPRHYGFHATLKAPFELASGVTEAALMQAVEQFVLQRDSITMDGLRPRELGRFLALVFSEQPVAIKTLARDCVVEFERFRAPLTPADVERRNPDRLKPRQRSYLDKYGYPHVLEDFRFHMTLSGALQRAEPEFFQWIRQKYEACMLGVPVLDRLAVYWQPDRDTPFVRKEEFLFRGFPVQ